MVTCKFLGQANLLRAQIFYVHELLKVVVVGKYKNFMLKAFEVKLSSF